MKRRTNDINDGGMHLSVAVRRALTKAEKHGVHIELYELSTHWICSADGEVARINDLPKVVESAIARQQHDQEKAA